jgi:hypothetical protein
MFDPLAPIFLGLRALIEAEARRRGVTVEAIAAELNQKVDQRVIIPMTMRAGP